MALATQFQACLARRDTDIFQQCICRSLCQLVFIRVEKFDLGLRTFQFWETLIEVSLHLSSCTFALTMAALDDDAKREYISTNAAADLQYVLEDSSVPLDLQYRLVRHYTSLKIFAAMGDTAAEIRAAARDDFTLDPAASAEARASVAKLGACKRLRSRPMNTLH